MLISPLRQLSPLNSRLGNSTFKLFSGLIGYWRHWVAGRWDLDYTEDSGLTWTNLASFEPTEETILRNSAYRYRIVDYALNVDQTLTATGYAGIAGTDWENLGVFSGYMQSPTELTLTVISSTENQLDWTNNGSHISHRISIERSDDGGSYAELTNLAYTVNNYHDTTALVGILYYYRVRYYIVISYSAYSNAVNNLTGDIATGLVGQWLLNDGAGSIAEDTGGANNGTIVGADWTIGKVGSALSFDGVAGHDSVKLGDILDSVFAGANKKFSISAWLKPAVNNMTSNVIVAKSVAGVSPTGQREFFFRIYTGSKLHFLWYGLLDGTTARGYLGTTAITDTSKWYHCTMTYDGTLDLDSRVLLYVDAIGEAITIDPSTLTPILITDGTAQLGIGASINTEGTASLSNFNGAIDSVNIFDRVLTYADNLSLKYKDHITPSSVKVFNYNAGQDEVFIDSLYKESSNLLFKVNNPVKYVSNPLFPVGINSDTWDADKNYNTVIKIGNNYHMWYGSCTAVGEYYSCYATSTDGITWTKPNLGLVTYAGNTNNNLFLGSGGFTPCVYYDSDGAADRKYVMVLANKPGAWVAKSVFIYKSADETNFTLIKTLTPSGSPYIEANRIIQRADGKWLAYYIKGGLISDREICAYLSDSSDLEGTWTDQGVLITTSEAINQKYHLGIELIDGVYYGFVANYNSTTEQIFTDLYISRDGLVWVLKQVNWIPLGAANNWDDEMIISGSMVKEGNEWRNYYNGFPENHAAAAPRDSRVGLATIGYKRIANIEGVGTFITTAFVPTLPLMINADLTHGTLQVELLLAADDSVIAGYSKDDMDVLAKIDTYSMEVKWNSNSIPTDTNLKIKFYFT